MTMCIRLMDRMPHMTKCGDCLVDGMLSELKMSCSHPAVGGTCGPDIEFGPLYLETVHNAIDVLFPPHSLAFAPDWGRSANIAGVTTVISFHFTHMSNLSCNRLIDGQHGI